MADTLFKENLEYTPPIDLLENKVILIIGASRGIGAAAAKTFAKYGATTILLSRSTEELTVVYDYIKKENYPEAYLCPLNLLNATPKDYENVVENIIEKWGKLDGILFNAAAISALTPLEYLSPKEWYEVFQVNLNSTFLISQACTNILKNSTDASVIFTLDNLSYSPKSYWGAYAISKGAKLSLLKILSQEWENTNIRINGIIPRPSKTKLSNLTYPAAINSFADPKDNMPTYLYLIGPDSKQENGNVFKS